jgi:hypothetical protein
MTVTHEVYRVVGENRSLEVQDSLVKHGATDLYCKYKFATAVKGRALYSIYRRN